MIRINLIPYRTGRRQQQIVQHIAVFVGVLVVAALLVLGVHSYESQTLADLKAETLRVAQQNKDLKQKIGKIENLDHLRADVERKLAIVDRLQEGRFRSLKTLHGIATEIPDNVWLDQVTDQDRELVLSGMAESNRAVAMFMRKLDQSPLFTDVRLGVISRVMYNGLPMRQFSLTLTREQAVKAKTAKSRVKAAPDV
ncbi:MAG: PilN domain-containing protein [Mariprofundus sp.]